MALEGRHRHRIGYEHWRYRRSYGRWIKFSSIPDKIKKNPGRLRLIIQYNKWIGRYRKFPGLKKITYQEYYSMGPTYQKFIKECVSI